MKPRKQIRRVSTNRSRQLREYAKLRKEWLSRNQTCEACLPRWLNKAGGNVKSNPATEIHHLRGKIHSLLCDTRFFVAVCKDCHRWIHDNPKRAMELSLLAPLGQWNNTKAIDQ